MVTTSRLSLFVAALSATACNVSALALPTGGTGDAGVTTGAPDAGGDAGVATSAPDAGGDAASDAGADASGACDHGTIVLLSDFLSSQIALSGLDGTTVSAAFLSSGSTKASNLAFALSGDVALAGTTPPSGRVVLIDRFGTNAITWADPVSGKVLAQLGVGTGFDSNPQDYLELDATRAYITRWGVNHAPGAKPFDTGSDILVVDTKMPAPAIMQSIAMPVEDGLPPRPSGMARVSDAVMVVLQRTSDDFKTVGESEVVGLTNDAIAWKFRTTGLKGCGRPALSPSHATMAVACQGQLALDGTVPDKAASAIALFDVTTLPPKPLKQFAIADQLGSTTQQQIAFVNDGLIFGKTQTPLGGATDNQAFTLDVTSGKATVIATASKDSMGKGRGVVYGDVLCRLGCGDICLMADADLRNLRRWSVAADGLHPMPDVTVETMTGLPPLGLGAY